MNKTRNILFLCTGNSCRSQMAEGLSKHFIGHGFNFYSAGTKSSSENSSAIAVMNEIGIDISEYRSKHVSELSNIQFDLVITLCGHAHENCPVFPSKCKIFHQGFEDPPHLVEELAHSGASEEEQLACYRKVRDEIRIFIEQFPTFLNKI